MTILEQVATYLSDQIASLTFGKTDPNSNIYINRKPKDKNDVVCIFNETLPRILSIDETRYMSIKMVYIGSQNPIESSEFIQQIFDLLDGFSSDYFVDGENFIVSCLQSSGIGTIESDERDFTEFITRFTIDYVL